jgi:hypothetical protein
MLVKHYSSGKFYSIACPQVRKFIRRSDPTASDGSFLADPLVVPFGTRTFPSRSSRPSSCRCWPSPVAAA